MNSDRTVIVLLMHYIGRTFESNEIRAYYVQINKHTAIVCRCQGDQFDIYGALAGREDAWLIEAKIKESYHYMIDDTSNTPGAYTTKQPVVLAPKPPRRFLDRLRR